MFIYLHYKYNLQLEKLIGARNTLETLRSSGLYKTMIGEMVYNMISCPPFLDLNFKSTNSLNPYHYSVDGLLFCVALARVYHIFRLYEHYSMWSSERFIKILYLYKMK